LQVDGTKSTISPRELTTLVMSPYAAVIDTSGALRCTAGGAAGAASASSSMASPSPAAPPPPPRRPNEFAQPEQPHAPVQPRLSLKHAQRPLVHPPLHDLQLLAGARRLPPPARGRLAAGAAAVSAPGGGGGAAASRRFFSSASKLESPICFRSEPSGSHEVSSLPSHRTRSCRCETRPADAVRSPTNSATIHVSSSSSSSCSAGDERGRGTIAAARVLTDDAPSSNRLGAARARCAGACGSRQRRQLGSRERVRRRRERSAAAVAGRGAVLIHDG